MMWSPAREAASRGGRHADRLARTASWSCGQVRADDQDVVVGVRGGQHLRRGRAECAGSVDLLKAGGLVGGPVGADPEMLRRAVAATVDVSAKNDGTAGGATSKERLECGALRRVRGHLIGFVGGKVRSAHLNAGAGDNAQPRAPLGTGLCLE